VNFCPELFSEKYPKNFEKICGISLPIFLQKYRTIVKRFESLASVQKRHFLSKFYSTIGREFTVHNLTDGVAAVVIADLRGRPAP